MISAKTHISRFFVSSATALCVALIIFSPSYSAAQQYLGVGLHLGTHYDAGNMSSYNANFEIEPQINYIIGVSLKANLNFLFLRSGVDISFPLIKGEVIENGDASDPIEKYSISYTCIPLLAGMNFPIFDIGEFYLGGGLAYFLATGTITHDGSRDNISTTALGYGFIAGIQLYISPKIRLYMEWEYFDARSDACMNTVTAPQSWDNLYIDFSGHRILLGVMYYAI